MKGADASEVFRVALKLGLTSFGGPIAHIGYFERTYVRQRRWLSAEQYGGIVALCQMLPGPTSSQIGFSIGLHRAGWIGAAAAWLGFALPSALLMYLCAVFITNRQGAMAHSLLHGLQLVAVAVVAQAVWNMAHSFCRDRLTLTIALAAACLLVSIGGPVTQLAVLCAAALAGMRWCRNSGVEAAQLELPISLAGAWRALGLFAVLLLALPTLGVLFPRSSVALADIFYRSGALVFGGGHVVLPLLRDAMVPPGWISDDRFLTGYGLAQAVPGPLFTLAAYLGAANAYAPSAWSACVAVIFIFLPGLLMTIGALALWSRVSRHDMVRSALAGVNAAVVGILAAALYNPVWKTAVLAPIDAGIALSGLLLLVRWRVPPIAVVLFTLVCSAFGDLI
ncbi:MAG TPA: chromate efflux transporter [Steroidobacteraceae bacterium]|nr:chromate efflux transporter [Steroidobacteraceae bacterium]